MYVRLIFPIILVLICFGDVARAQVTASSPARGASLRGRAAFVENRGQWDPSVRFLCRVGGLATWITGDGITYDLHRVDQVADREDRRTSAVGNRIAGHVVRMSFEGASSGRHLHGVGGRSGVYSYCLGSDPSRWVSGVDSYDEVLIAGLYNGIDAILRSEGELVRYDLAVAPGADPAVVRLRIDGADSIGVTDKGTLTIATSVGVLEQGGLYAYQDLDGERRQVECRFALRGDGGVGFELGRYDRSRSLVIDPIAYSTFVGGSDDDIAAAVAVDPIGNVYMTGYSLSSDYPTNPGAYDRDYNGDKDVVVTKLDSTESTLIYSTYIGGIDEDRGQGIRVDAEGAAYIVGYTKSRDFPTTPGAFETEDTVAVSGFVVKLAPDGSAPRYSTFLGGYANSFNFAFAVAIDESGNAYVTGRTTAGNFPTTDGAYSGEHGGSYDLFVSKLNPDGSDLLFSTLIGGSGWDEAEAIAVDTAHNVYVTGYTDSPNYPVTSGAFDETYNGMEDAFITRLAADGGTLLYSTLLGGSGRDIANGVAVDVFANAYVTGSTNSPGFPVTTRAIDRTYGGGDDVFVTKLGSGGDLLEYSTFVGGDSSEIGFGIGVNKYGEAYVTGRTQSPTFPASGDPYDESLNGGYDMFVAKLNKAGSDLLYSTFVGTAGYDAGYAIAVEPRGDLYVAGFTDSPDFPTTSGAYDRTGNVGRASFVVKLPLASPDPIGSGFDMFPYSSSILLISAPNPVRDELRIGFRMEKSASATLELISSDGAIVRSPFVDRTFEVGTYSAVVDVRELPSGSYLLRLSMPGGVGVDRVVVLR